MRFALLITGIALLGTAYAQRAPITTMTARVMPDGKHVWQFTSTWDARYFKRARIDPEVWLQDQIARALGAKQLCPDGWSITERAEVSGTLVVTGECSAKE